MYCVECGKELAQHASYCSQCGKSTRVAPRPHPYARLTRPREGKWIAGVCAGVARHLDINVTLVRIAWVLLTITPPVPGIIVYIICWIAMPVDQPVWETEPTQTSSEHSPLPG